MSKDGAIETIEYWLGIEECVCKSAHPIGGCLKCDLEQLKKFIQENT